MSCCCCCVCDDPVDVIEAYDMLIDLEDELRAAGRHELAVALSRCFRKGHSEIDTHAAVRLIVEHVQ